MYAELNIPCYKYQSGTAIIYLRKKHKKRNTETVKQTNMQSGDYNEGFKCSGVNRYRMVTKE